MSYVVFHLLFLTAQPSAFLDSWPRPRTQRPPNSLPQFSQRGRKRKPPLLQSLLTVLPSLLWSNSPYRVLCQAWIFSNVLGLPRRKVGNYEISNPGLSLVFCADTKKNVHFWGLVVSSKAVIFQSYWQAHAPHLPWAALTYDPYSRCDWGPQRWIQEALWCVRLGLTWYHWKRVIETFASFPPSLPLSTSFLSFFPSFPSFLLLPPSLLPSPLPFPFLFWLLFLSFYPFVHHLPFPVFFPPSFFPHPFLLFLSH